MNRKTVVLAWGLVLALLIPAYADDTAAGEEHWYGIYQADRKIGYNYDRLLPRDGYYINLSHTEIDLAMGDMKVGMRIDGRLAYDTAYQPISFNYRIKGGLINMRVHGRVVDDVMQVTVVWPDNRQELALPLADVTLAPLADIQLRTSELNPGDVYTFNIFDPTVAQDGQMRVTVEGREEMLIANELRPVTRLRSVFAGIESTTYLDADGVPLLMTAPMGMVLRREEKELALAPVSGEPVNLMWEAAITPSAPIAGPRRLFAADYILRGADLSAMALAGGGQFLLAGDDSVDGVAIRIRRPPRLPDTLLGARRPELGEYLAFDMLIDGDAESVARLAAELREGKTTVRETVRADIAWLQENIRQRLTLSLPRASQVLAERRGDCNEFAVLMTALLRAQGIPCRPVAGVVYLNGKFYYHAWCEAWAGDWYAVDPVFAQEIADATHIRLVEGDLLAQARLLNVIGRLAIDPAD